MQHSQQHPGIHAQTTCSSISHHVKLPNPAHCHTMHSYGQSTQLGQNTTDLTMCVMLPEQDLPSKPNTSVQKHRASHAWLLCLQAMVTGPSTCCTQAGMCSHEMERNVSSQQISAPRVRPSASQRSSGCLRVDAASGHLGLEAALVKGERRGRGSVYASAVRVRRLRIVCRSPRTPGSTTHNSKSIEVMQ